MRTLTRLVAAVVGAAGVPACSVIVSSAHVDLVATTATVLKVVDGDTVDIATSGAATHRVDTPETK